MGAGLKRHRKTETVGVEQLTGRGGQGEPTYAASSNIEGFVVSEATGLARDSSGELTKAETKLLVADLTQSPLPAQGDRITLASGAVRIVTETSKPRNRRGVADHLEVTAVEE